MLTHQTLLIIFALVAIYAVITGFIKGILAQLGQIVGMVVGILASRALAPNIFTMFVSDADAQPASMITEVLCYILVYVVAYFAVVLLFKLLRVIVKVVSLGILDRLAGAVFKLIKWALIVSLVYNLYVAISPDASPSAEEYPIESAIYAFAPKALDMYQATTGQ